MLNAFEASSEFATLANTLYGNSTSDGQRTENFVTNFYQGAFSAPPSPTQLASQSATLNNAAALGQAQVISAAETMGRNLFAGQVNDAGLSNTQFVTNLYEGFLQRGPDAGGLAFWSGGATVGTGRQNVLNSFATSPPFRELAGTLYREAFWLVTDHLGTPRMVVNKSGSLASVKRHDYLPFGEELFAGTGGRTTGQGYTGDSVRQKFTAKERDNETNLDYFLARYYASTQGRFTGADPYDINFERQMTSDPEEAEDLFRDYIFQPQHWNRYAYALNSPLRYVDPDGRLEYETELLGKKIKVKISDNLRSADGQKLKGDDLKAAQEKIKNNIDSAIGKINSGADKLTSEQKTAINSMKGIEVRTDIRAPGMNGSTFQMTQRYAATNDPETLPAAFIHDSFHADQNRRGVPSSGREAEKQASAFTVPILEKLGMSNRIIEVYKRDAKEGHGSWGQRTRPPKKKTP